MRLVTCGSCGFIGSEQDIESYEVAINELGLPGSDPDPSGLQVGIRKIKDQFEDIVALQSNLDFQYDGCPSCESHLIFYKDLVTVCNIPSFTLTPNNADSQAIAVSSWEVKDVPESEDVVEPTPATPPQRTPRTRPVESTKIKAVCDVCSNEFKSSNTGPGSLGGKCPKCTNELLG